MKKAVIEFKDFSFQYRAQQEPTLTDINLTIAEGEKVLIVGPSGSGKSTLAHCINGLIPFAYKGEMSGSLRIMGLEQKELSIAALSDQVGTVLQDPDGQFVGLTVGEDIAFSLENHAVQQAEMIEKVVAAATAVDIHEYLGASPQELSGGQKQKTTLAGVLVGDVDILLFDEPLANLDPYTGTKAIELIDRVQKETGKTVIIIEHRLEEVLHRAVDRIIVIHDGRLAADMPAAELLSTGLLSEAGIREPLYLTALKYAGCTIASDMNPQHIDEIQLDSCSSKLEYWYDNNNSQQDKRESLPILELRDVSFGYEKSRPVLHKLNLLIHKGEMVCIAGRNGAGKSTVSKLICGFYKPTSGSILMNGRDIAKDTIKERAERIGFVMQNPNHMISKTLLYDEVALGLKLRGVSEELIRERVHHVLKICGLYAFRSWPISALSYGQKKRVTIASIMILEPEVIILDEPTAAQDYRHYNEMMEFLLTLREQGMTVIMITHDMHLMLEYADRAVVLSDGVKLADDSPERVLTNLEVVRNANLKETSLFTLAMKVQLDQPEEFVRRFIAYDRRSRGG
ncbi:energy-coupling factor transporter ATP-binding protein EcfA2 [Paenibacillus sp. PastF-3]|jgi:energy-coupling factor transport system ATP-binding protein|uniref:ABC transporter ATP-binding protein n=1 Tax=Paenibacillus sp. PastF-3 TaxID=2940626 RepID=UPI002475D5C0|nr:ABC transporter ATP-binding protein [Paenibacillus sp. PastF-3]MDH6370130.1 energy-coupling factor transporter ATP-binding protein EcfA2 [Paenibacillus sp. PastF-3]